MPDLGTPKRIPFDPSVAQSSIFHALAEARLEYGGDTVTLVDGDDRALTYDELIRASFALGSALKHGTHGGDCVGVMLPTGAAAPLTVFALSIDDYVITLFSAGHTLTFPLWVVGASRLGIPPEVNVLGTLILLLAFVMIAIQTWQGRRSGREETGPVTLVGR